jgi:uncharacterized protein (TIGR00730 family)
MKANSTEGSGAGPRPWDAGAVAHRVCVFCGSSIGTDPAYARVAADLGATLARDGRTLVYGGGDVGLMGVVADAALAAGGEVVGVIPDGLLVREVGHAALTELRVTASMHERKATMVELADSFVALPGGLGTFEELCEVLTWAQLGIHRKPVVVLDVEGFYDPLFALLDQAVEQGFVKAAHRALAVRVSSVAEALAACDRPAPAPVRKWIDLEEV